MKPFQQFLLESNKHPEMAMYVEDYLARRSRMLFLNAKAAIESAAIVAKLMAEEMGKDDVWEKDQVQEFAELAKGYIAKV